MQSCKIVIAALIVGAVFVPTPDAMVTDPSAATNVAELARCTEVYSDQCALTESVRGAIASANSGVANSREMILDALTTIKRCEEFIPETKQKLEEHNDQCADEVNKMKDHLKIVEDDSAVMTTIMEITDCASNLLQMKSFALLRCKNECTEKDQISFNHKDLMKHMRQLKSSVSLDLVEDVFSDMFEDNEPLQLVQLMQVDGSDYQDPKLVQLRQAPANETKCDPYAVWPSPEDKRAAKCTIIRSPQCNALQTLFILLQSGIQDERDQLLDDIASLDQSCEEEKKTLETVISIEEDLLSTSRAKLVTGAKIQAKAEKLARQANEAKAQYNADLVNQMNACSANDIKLI